MTQDFSGQGTQDFSPAVRQRPMSGFIELTQVTPRSEQKVWFNASVIPGRVLSFMRLPAREGVTSASMGPLPDMPESTLITFDWPGEKWQGKRSPYSIRVRETPEEIMALAREVESS